MIAGYRMRRAAECDLGEIMEILESRRRWLDEEKFSDQWHDVAGWRRLLRYLIRHGKTWVMVTADEDDVIVGTVTLSTEPDVTFWSPEEQRRPALYLSKLATDPHWARRELGSEMLAWALEYAGHAGFPVVRLDAWRRSSGLHDYYVKRGWHHVRTETIAGRQSGDLFDHPTRRPLSTRITRMWRMTQRPEPVEARNRPAGWRLERQGLT